MGRLTSFAVDSADVNLKPCRAEKSCESPSWYLAACHIMLAMLIQSIRLPSGNLMKLVNIAIYSWFTHWKWWFSTVMLERIKDGATIACHSMHYHGLRKALEMVCQASLYSLHPKSQWLYYVWLVVWSISYFPYWKSSSQLTNIFRGVETTCWHISSFYTLQTQTLTVDLEWWFAFAGG